MNIKLLAALFMCNNDMTPKTIRTVIGHKEFKYRYHIHISLNRKYASCECNKYYRKDNFITIIHIKNIFKKGGIYLVIAAERRCNNDVQNYST